MNALLLTMRDKVLPIARVHAADVDARARFPHETFAALKAHGLMGALVPTDFGGPGLSVLQVAELCSALGQACGSSALIYAMHHIKTSSLVAHGPGSPWHEAFMRRVAHEQLLLGSATTEGGIGGDVRNSICAIEPLDTQEATPSFRLFKDATVISYGAYADAILVTARKDAQAPSSDQVLLVAERHQMELVQHGSWDTLGMRGTCSYGFKLTVNAPTAQIFPAPFADIAAQSMLAHTHIFWAAAWYGLAAQACAQAQALVKAESRRRAANGADTATPSPGALRLAELLADLQAMQSMVVGGVLRLEQAQKDSEQLSSNAFLLDMNALKLNTSQAVVAILNKALLVCGIHGYRNDSPYSLGRLLRDAQSSTIMINNDRILHNTANMVLMARVGSQLAD